MRIGLEIHLQLPTESKMFCSCPTEASLPNSSICPTCLGFPGSRPRTNRKAVEMGLRIAKYLRCEIPRLTWFSRKTYFYPDLPKNFQITQYDTPIGERGSFGVGEKTVRITRVHLEEDPGRIRRVGRPGEEVSLIDYNRSGIPLVEIVTEPDLSSPEEARDFLTDLLIELRHLVGLTERHEQSVRVDANISVGEERVEVKNILGLRNLERGLRFEAVRQRKLLSAGKKVVRETRRFDEERRVTLPSRKKEFEEDYGYIAEPDLGVFHAEAMAREIELPETPLRRAKRLAGELELPPELTRQIVLTSSALTDLMEYLCSILPPKSIAPWITGPLSSSSRKVEERMSEDFCRKVSEIILKVHNGEITDIEGREALESLLEGKEVETLTPQTVSRSLDQIVKDVMDRHPDVVRDYLINEKAANFLIGQVMKETRGRHSSKEVVVAVKRELDRRL